MAKHICNTASKKPEAIEQQTTSRQTAEAEVEQLRTQSLTIHKEAMRASTIVARVAGIVQHGEFVEKASRLAVLKTLWQLKQTGAYKGAFLPHHTTGEIVEVQTWEETCATLGYSRSKIDEDFRNMALFGDDYVRLQEQLGIGYRELRVIRAGLLELPPEEQQRALEEVSKSGDKEELLAALDEMGVRNTKLQKERDEAEADKKAKDELLGKKSNKIQELETQLQKLTHPVAGDPEKLMAETENAIRQAITEACNRLIGQARELANIGSASMSKAPQLEDWINQQTGLACSACTDVLYSAGLDAAMEQGWATPDPEACAREAVSRFGSGATGNAAFPLLTTVIPEAVAESESA